MYLIEYFKLNGKTITLETNDYNEMSDLVLSILKMIDQGSVISFNVEKID